MSVELLAPARSPEALDAAIGEGADAVYLGLKSFNARMRSANFTYAQFEAAIRSLHRKGKKLYVTVNTVFEQREADRMYQLLKYLADAGPDALIVQDFGVVAMARSCFPQLKLHASTQMNIAGARGVNALSRNGVSRVVLARELTLEELRAVRAETNMELEIFVHGALCVSASGICLFSSFLGGKSANRGMCTQACRRLYHCGRGGSETSGNGRGNGAAGYFFSPGDLQLVSRVPDLINAGMDAFKIEGRMKSADYVGTVVSAYRLVIDAAEGGDEGKIRESIAKGQELLRNDFARAKTEFYFDMGTQAEASSLWLNPAQDGGTGISLGGIIAVKNSGAQAQALIRPDDAAFVPRRGDTIRLHRGDDSGRVSHKLSLIEQAGDEAADGWWISVPDGFGPGDRVYLIQTKSMSRRYEPVIAARGVAGGGHAPGREKAPFPKVVVRETQAAGGGKNRKDLRFPEGLYVAVSRVEDMYILQSSRPARVILGVTRKITSYLLADNKPPLPFKPGEIILALDPYFPQAQAQPLAEQIGRLFEKGYRQFMVNNPGHLSLFRGLDAPRLIAGPWLYMFNRWALSFTAAWGVDGFISPLENNRQNLERTLSQENDKLRSMFFIPVFEYPPLFRIRADLGKVYNFSSFTGSQGEEFSLVTDPEGSRVIPLVPFSITDKIPFLKEAGFGRFIIDLRGPPLKKGNYRDLMKAVSEGTPLPRVSRFNWKDGFFQSGD